ncbi:unnamed protein product [Caenorhabditis brenneri]
MGGSNSKSSIFDEYPTNYTDVPNKGDHWAFKETNWIYVLRDGYSTSFRIKGVLFPDRRQYEFAYQIIFINKYHLRRRMVIRGVVKMDCGDWLFSKTIDNVFYKPSYNQFNFQAVEYATIKNNGLRKLNFKDENVYGKSILVSTTGKRLVGNVPIQTINLRAPLLAKHISEKKPFPALYSCSEDFFQIFHGVHIQLEADKMKTLLKLSVKFQVLNVKRYCEQQLIRREDLKVSEKRKFKMACKFNLNTLMNQVLRNIKSVKKLAKLASIAIEMESIDANIAKLLIARVYKIS